MLQNAARSLIAARLQELGHPRDFITPAAESEIIGRAAGSKRALSTILSATLFIASTEDAPHIEPAHVGQATLGDPPPARSTPRMAAAGACAALSLLLILIPTYTRHPPERPLPAAPLRQAAAVVSRPHPAAPTPPPASPLDRLIAQLPAEPSPVVHLFAAQPDAAEAATLAAHLQNAGLQPTIFQAVLQPGPDPVHVRYYFVEDRPLAERAASLAGAPAPELVARTKAGAVPPGSIDVVLRESVPQSPTADRAEKKPAIGWVACNPPSRTKSCKQPALHAMPKRHVPPAHPAERRGFLASVGRFFGSIFQSRRTVH